MASKRKTGENKRKDGKLKRLLEVMIDDYHAINFEQSLINDKSMLKKVMKTEQKMTKESDSAPDTVEEAISSATDSELTRDTTCVLPEKDQENVIDCEDRKEGIHQIFRNVRDQAMSKMPRLDKESVFEIEGSEGDNELASLSTSSSNMDDTPPRLTVAKTSSAVTSCVCYGENENRDELCANNSSPPPLDKYANSIPNSAIIESMLYKDVPSSTFSIRSWHRSLPMSCFDEFAADNQSFSRKSFMEPEWTNKLAEVLAGMPPKQLLAAKETALSTMVKLVAQEISTDLSGLMSLIDGRDRRAAAFEKVLSELKRLRSDS